MSYRALTAFANPPSRADLYHLCSARLAALMPTFVVVDAFWANHQRRLARQPDAFPQSLYNSVLTLDGRVLALGQFEDLIGQNLIETKDSSARLFMKDGCSCRPVIAGDTGKE